MRVCRESRVGNSFFPFGRVVSCRYVSYLFFNSMPWNYFDLVFRSSRVKFFNVVCYSVYFILFILIFSLSLFFAPFKFESITSNVDIIPCVERGRLEYKTSTNEKQCTQICWVLSIHYTLNSQFAPCLYLPFFSFSMNSFRLLSP